MQVKVAAALMQWRLIERALHDPSDWEMEVAGVRVPVTVEVGDAEVRFVADMPEVCFLGEAPPMLSLFHHGDLLRMIESDALEDGDSRIEWILSMDPVAA